MFMLNIYQDIVKNHDNLDLDYWQNYRYCNNFLKNKVLAVLLWYSRRGSPCLYICRPNQSSWWGKIEEDRRHSGRQGWAGKSFSIFPPGRRRARSSCDPEQSWAGGRRWRRSMRGGRWGWGRCWGQRSPVVFQGAETLCTLRIFLRVRHHIDRFPQFLYGLQLLWRQI